MVGKFIRNGNLNFFNFDNNFNCRFMCFKMTLISLLFNKRIKKKKKIIFDFNSVLKYFSEVCKEERKLEEILS